VTRTRSRLAALTLIGMLTSLLPMGALPAAATDGDLVITGVIDGPLSGGLPKAIELYAVNDIADLSIYGVGSASNGSGSDDVEFTFPADSVPADSFIYLGAADPRSVDRAFHDYLLGFRFRGIVALVGDRHNGVAQP